MRQIWVKTPIGKGKKVLDTIDADQAEHIIMFQAHDPDRQVDIVILNVPNNKVSDIIQGVNTIEGNQVILDPNDVLPLVPGEEKVSSHITKVTNRSPIEIWLNALQSIGPWAGFLGYAFGASAIVWIGMYTDTIYLLIAAMLIAPVAGPAMGVAIATATGDFNLLWRNLARYFVALTIIVVIAAVLSLLTQQNIATNTMIQVSEISSLSILLPLVAGAAGALNLTQSSNNSLVTGTATGTLVAASLAPPAGLIGMALALQRWDMAVNGTFLLFMQLFGINLAGGLVFRAFNLKPGSTFFERGRGWLFYASLGVSLVALAGLLVLQFWSSPNLQRTTRAQEANGLIQQMILDYPHAELVQADVSFPRPSRTNQNLLLTEVTVLQAQETSLELEQIRQELAQQIRQRLANEYNVEPLVTVNVFERSE